MNPFDPFDDYGDGPIPADGFIRITLEQEEDLKKAKKKTLADRAVGAAMTRTDGGRWRKKYTRRKAKDPLTARNPLAPRAVVKGVYVNHHQEPTQTQDESGSRKAMQSDAHAAVDRFHGLIAVIDQQVAQHKLSSILTVLRAKVLCQNDEMGYSDATQLLIREAIVALLSRAIAASLSTETIETAGPEEATTEG